METNITWDTGFGIWMKQVNEIMDVKIGLRSDDLPDYHYADDFDEGKSPRFTAMAAIRNCKDEYGD